MQNACRIDDQSELEREADQAISEHNGDARETVKSLLVANAYLEVTRDKAISLLSRGFVRGQFDTSLYPDPKR